MFRSFQTSQGMETSQLTTSSQTCFVVGGEPKTLMSRVRSKHGHDRFAENPRTNAARPAAVVKALGWAGRAKVCLMTDSAGPVWMKPREAKSMVSPRVSKTPWPSIRIVGEVRRDTWSAPTWRATCRGSLPPSSKFVSDRVSDPDG
jgi:hypothetical protein